MNSSIAIIGSGAVGLYYGGLLAHAGNDVRFLMRSGYDEARRQGIRIFNEETEWRIHPAQVHRDTASIGICDYVIIAVKTFQNPALPEILPPIIGNDTHLLTLQNGLGNETFLATHFVADRVLGGMCFVCLNRTSPATVHHIDHGLISMAPLMPAARNACESIAAKLRATGTPVEVHADIHLERWKKLMWNIPFNGLAIAHGGVAVDEILKNAALTHECRALMEEIREIAFRLGHEIPRNFVEQMMARTSTMGAYRPSTLVDYLNGRDIELEAIWGEPLQQATEIGAPRQHLQHLYSKLKSRLALRSHKV